MKRTNIDEMICKQEGIAEVTREALNKIQLAKLNAVLKREKEREGSVYDRVGAGEKQWKDASVFTGRSPESNLRTDEWNNRCR